MNAKKLCNKETRKSRALSAPLGLNRLVRKSLVGAATRMVGAPTSTRSPSPQKPPPHPLPWEGSI